MSYPPLSRQVAGLMRSVEQAQAEAVPKVIEKVSDKQILAILDKFLTVRSIARKLGANASFVGDRCRSMARMKSPLVEVEKSGEAPRYRRKQ